MALKNICAGNSVKDVPSPQPSSKFSVFILSLFAIRFAHRSNVGVTLLTAVTITFSVSGGLVRKPFDADTITDTLMGTEFCMLATLAACFATALLRDDFFKVLEKEGRFSYLHIPPERATDNFRTTSQTSSSASAHTPVSYTRIASLASGVRSSADTTEHGMMYTLQPVLVVLMVLFLIPALTMDAVEFTYTGAGSYFLKDDVTSIRVKVRRQNDQQPAWLQCCGTTTYKTTT